MTNIRRGQRGIIAPTVNLPENSPVVEAIEQASLTATEIVALLDAYYVNTDWRQTDYSLQDIPTFSSSSNLLLEWANDYVRSTSASAVNVTVQPESSIPHVAKTVSTLRQVGAGQITLVAGAGVTFNVRAAEGLKTAEQHAEIQLTYIGSNVWDIRGGIA